jgi:hypothetical protein
MAWSREVPEDKKSRRIRRSHLNSSTDVEVEESLRTHPSGKIYCEDELG